MRPSKLTPDLHRRIVGMIVAGVPPETAAGACGVERATLYEWVQRGSGEHPTRKPSPALTAFARDVSMAADAAEAKLALRVAEFAAGTKPSTRKPGTRVRTRITAAQITATQWLLSRLFAARWAQLPVSLTNTVTVTANAEIATPESAREAVKKLFGTVTPELQAGEPNAEG